MCGWLGVAGRRGAMVANHSALLATSGRPKRALGTRARMALASASHSSR